MKGSGSAMLPHLLVIIDTEEEFDWTRPHSRAETHVTHIKALGAAQRILERYAIKPIYVVDYPVASQEAAYRPLREWFADRRCDIGAHLHPWVNPPFTEEVSVRNSYAGNLPRALEREKLRILGETISANFGRAPSLYRAGRFGIGPATPEILEELGYECDSSVVPHADFRADHGPDFRGIGDEPFWIGPTRRVLEIPQTVGWAGLLSKYGPVLEPIKNSKMGRHLHMAGVMARLRLSDRIRLTPEGMTAADLRRLTRAMLRAGKWLFSFTYHSPSLAPGNTPYVRDSGELERFLGCIEEYCDFFFGTCGGVAGVPADIRTVLKNAQGRQ